ncbi:MAG: type II secretion system F family protein, partial [Gammaproteobacteria bacterium]|nr:type II secretion system F family protein [Gammaproteobacteria bacterium]
NGPVIWFFAAAALLLGLAAVLFFGGRRIDINQAVQQRFRTLILEAVVTKQQSGHRHALAEWWTRKLLRAGLEATKRTTLLMLSGLVAALFVGLAVWGGQGLLLPASVLLSTHLYLDRRARLRAAAMLGQLPGFIDHIIRGLSTGRTMENTVLMASDQCRPPLQDILQRVRGNVELGAHLNEELQQAARMHRLRELQLLALAVHVNQRFGGSARELLQSIVTMIQQRDQAQRELRALTGETRLSAWVLGLLPIGVAAYMMVMNPSYLEFMWLDASGRKVLLTALGMQCAGAVLLWRMVRSI